MSTLFNTFSHSTCTASIRPINLKRSIGEGSLLTLLIKEKIAYSLKVFLRQEMLFKNQVLLDDNALIAPNYLVRDVLA